MSPVRAARTDLEPSSGPRCHTVARGGSGWAVRGQEDRFVFDL